MKFVVIVIQEASYIVAEICCDAADNYIVKAEKKEVSVYESYLF